MNRSTQQSLSEWSADELYLFYIRGCRRLGITPDTSQEFWSQYIRYLRALKFLRHFDQWVSRHPGQKPKNERRWRLYQKAEAEWKALRWIKEAIQAGMKDDFDAGGAGVAVLPLPPLPVLCGTGARLLPHLDPEPAFRDP
jgi:hypothetical protein